MNYFLCYLGRMVKPPLLGLVMIVKDEALGIVRTLESIREVIDRFDILDTGSTDGTPDLIRTWAKRRGVLGKVTDGTFYDFSNTRNAVLSLCPTRWALMLSGDEIATPSLYMRPFLAESLHSEHDATVTYNRIQFLHPRLTRPRAGGRYVGTTHEQFLAANLGPPVDLAIRGGRRGEDRTARLERDLELLLDENTPRAHFYGAQTLESLGRTEEALRIYRHRAQDWDGCPHERWEAMIRAGRLGAITMLYVAARERPERAEPWYYLALHYRRRGKLATARKCLDRAAVCDKPTGRGFVHLDAYEGIETERIVQANLVLGRDTIQACPDPS